MIRKADKRDVERILYVINYTNQFFYRNIIPKEYFKEPVLSRTELELLFEKQWFCVYEINHAIVGVASLEKISESEGMVHWVYVLPKHERRGAGTSLMNSVEEEAKRIGLRGLMLFANARATWAIAFYKKLGYRAVGSREKPWGKDVIFKKEINERRKFHGKVRT